jgi:hypothetical protein
MMTIGAGLMGAIQTDADCLKVQFYLPAKQYLA